MKSELELFDRQTARWFTEFVGTPTAVQEEGWPAIANGGHTLISAPTGTGKTLSAFLVYIDRLKALARQGELPQELHLLYVSPLKALGNDIRQNLRRPLEGIAGPEITVAIRNGDTAAAERRRMLKTPPHILITTPESLYLLLTSQSGQRMLSTARAVIIDELHALINGKRGAHLMLSLARLDKLCGQSLQRIGLSATIEPLEQAADYLAWPEPVTIVAPHMQKAVDIEVNSPLPDMRVLQNGTIWPEIARIVHDHCEGARTVIAFVEGRAMAEKLAYHVNQIAGDGFARTHHGCVSKEQRLEAEEQLRSGTLRLLCATSSMELGIDVGEVDLVLQIGAPQSISSTMQRLGRAGHNPGRTSVMHLFPRTAAESVTCGLTAKVAMDGGIERSTPPRKCLDVLAQHLVSMAAVNGYSVADAMALAHTAYNFKDVTAEELRGVLRMLAGDFEHRLDRPARPRVLYDRIHGTVQGDAYSRMLALSTGGTIPDRGMFAARLADGTKLGELDEEYVFEARIGDKFLLGAFAWRIAEIRQESVIVEPCGVEGAQVPFWKGDMAGRTYQTGLAFGAELRALTEAYGAGRLFSALRALKLDASAAENAERYLVSQMDATGGLPDDRTVIVEHFRDQAGESQVMIHSIYGRKVNGGISLLLREEIRRTCGMDVSCFDEDDGFLLFPYGSGLTLPDGLLQRLRPDNARERLALLLPAAPMFNMAFRYNAGRALMMGARQGRRQPLWVQRLRGAQVLDDAVGQSDHPLIAETKRECLEDYWDIPAIEEVLRGIRSGAIAVREVHRVSPSPMSLPLRRQAEATMMYDYFPTPSSVFQTVENTLADNEMIPAAPEQLEKVAERARQPRDAQALHSLLLMEGDLIAGEVDVPYAWLEGLSRQGRACYIEPGLWICQEQAEDYQAVMEVSDDDARRRIVRRCLRYRGPQTAGTLSGRYFWPEACCEELLRALADTGAAVESEGLYYHAELYSRARRQTVLSRRKQAETLPPEGYAALLCQRMRLSARAQEQLRHGMEALEGQAYPPELWESVLLPARVSDYKPALLDELLGQGEYFWRMIPGDRPLLSFHRHSDTDWTQPPLAVGEPLVEAEEKIVTALTARGATFAQGLSGILDGKSPLDVLLSLARKGLVRADSFVPVRLWLDNEKKNPSEKQRAHGRAGAAVAGRWELARPLIERPMEEALTRAFDRSVLLCRETAQGITWTEALQALRVLEYTGRVRRGYFIRGLSGAQFIRDEDAEGAVLAMRQPRQETVWLNAADPAQPYGKIFPHAKEQAFLCVSGTAVALKAGIPVAVLERNGQTLRVLRPEALHDAMAAFVRDFEQGRVFAKHKRITVKAYPKEAAKALEDAGFTRQMLDYELWRRHG